MEDEKVKLIIIDDDEGRVALIKRRLNEEIYSIEAENDWQRSLDKILKTEYSLIILSYRLSGGPNDSGWILAQLDKKDPKKLDIPFLFSIGADDDVKSIEKTLKGKRFRFIDKDSKDYLGEMEWAIINLLPGIFYIHRKNIERSLTLSQTVQEKLEDLDRKIESKSNKETIDSLSQKNKELSDKIDKSNREIERIFEDQADIKEKYVSWRDITESLGLIVGAFALVIGIIITVMESILKLGKNETITPSWILFAGLLLVLSSLWGFIVYNCIRNKANKIIKKKLKEYLMKKPIEEIISEQIKTSRDRSDNG